MTTPVFSNAKRNAMIVAAEGRLLVPALLTSTYRLASDDGSKNAPATGEVNTAIGELISAGLLRRNNATGKIELTSSGRTTLTQWAGRTY